MCYTFHILITQFTYDHKPRQFIQYLWAYPTCSAAMWPCHSLVKRWSLSLQPWIWVGPVTALTTEHRAGVRLCQFGIQPLTGLASHVLLLVSQLPCKTYVPTLGEPHCEKPRVAAEVLEEAMPYGYRKRPKSNKEKQGSDELVETPSGKWIL